MKLAAAVSLLVLVKGERVSIYLYRLVRLPLFQAFSIQARRSARFERRRSLMRIELHAYASQSPSSIVGALLGTYSAQKGYDTNSKPSVSISCSSHRLTYRRAARMQLYAPGTAERVCRGPSYASPWCEDKRVRSVADQGSRKVWLVECTSIPAAS